MNPRRFVITDIHGCFTTLHYLLEKTLGLRQEDHLYILGDYINKGPQSKEVLDYLMEITEYQPVTLLRGNHEQVLLDVLDNKASLFDLYEKGGMHTMTSFQVEHPAQIENKYISFLRSLPLYMELDDCWLVHAGFNLSIADPLLDKNAMLNNRHMACHHAFFKHKPIIHGHIPQPLSYITGRLRSKHWNIYLDSGCVYPDRPGMGFLSVLELNQWYFTCKECLDNLK